MLVLGLHFGHDASIAILGHGKILSFVQRERIARIKHAYSLDETTLDVALDRAGVEAQDIDVVAVTSTQGCEPVLARFPSIQLAYASTTPLDLPCPLVETLGSHLEVAFNKKTMAERVLGEPFDPRTHPAFRQYLAEYRGISFDDLRQFPWFDVHMEAPQWQLPLRLVDLAQLDVREIIDDHRYRFGFHYPLNVTLRGKKIPGLRLDHHLAHASSVYFQSSRRNALIITNDGYSGSRSPFSSGGVYYGRGNEIYPLFPHFANHGHFYDAIARHLGLGAIGGSGKLMGLAPYGSPKYFSRRFVGNRFDHGGKTAGWAVEDWLTYAIAAARKTVADDLVLKDRLLPFTRFELDLAASAQQIFEEHWVAIFEAAQNTIQRLDLRQQPSLCLSGGSALNCPANARLSQIDAASDLFVEPTCDDSGLSIGAAYWVYSVSEGATSRFDQPLRQADIYTSPYSAKAVDDACLDSNEYIHWSTPMDVPLHAAADLQKGFVVAWFEGGGERGPRALGHRSILADPTREEMHLKVNRIKEREVWRPLAPAILKGKEEEFFHVQGASEPSAFMLTTWKFRRQSMLPAVTHIDRSARPQTVGPGTGMFFKVLRNFFLLTGVPMLINTSLNLRGEPIAETPTDATSIFLRTDIDVLYLDGRRGVKSGQKIFM